MTIGCMKYKTRAYLEKHKQLRDELAGSCSSMPLGEARIASERASPPVRRWWNEGAFA